MKDRTDNLASRFFAEAVALIDVAWSAVAANDGNALWERQRSDLRQLSATLAEKDLTIVATTQSMKPVTDCGTDG
ncbi:hypothetical protein ACQRWP_17260 [Micromonospora trifolii]|uniref:hypothetical protein n=1 Tax=Micromonospora trifolii TaxID=2911208 RepID=UPI003D2F322E